MIFVFLFLAIIAVAALVVLAVSELKNHGVNLLSGLSTAEIARGVTATRLDSQPVPDPIQTQLDTLASRLDHITELLVELADKKDAEALHLPVPGLKSEKKSGQKKKTPASGSGTRKGPKKQLPASGPIEGGSISGEQSKAPGSTES
jgi:hypothetical protein